MTNQDTRWMTIREVALALAVSELTVRRRIKDGRLRHKLINGKYFVDLQSSPGTLDSGEDSDLQTGPPSSRGDQPAPRMITQETEEVDGPAKLRAAAQGSPATESRNPQPEEGRPAPGINLDALLAEHARLAEIAGRAGLLQEQYAELNARHEELRAGMLSLAGRNGWLESKLEERESELKLLTDRQPRPSWWKRLFGQ